MGGGKRPRHGSLQFWPRKRAARFLPGVNNWGQISGKGILGFIVYKVGMATAIVKDTTDKSMTANKSIAIPVTILEAPNMKILSVRFYKGGLVVKDIVVSNDKELKRVVKVSKSLKPIDSEAPKEFDDIRVIAYSIPKQTSVKKTPDLIELGISADNKLEFVKSLIGKEISLKDFAHPLVDARGLTKGKGLIGPLKRMHLEKKSHKSEKGVRRPGSLGPWHPHLVTFRVAQAGQGGMFSRVIYNLKSVKTGSIAEKDINPKEGFAHYGKIRSNYIILKGSVQGPQKRQVLLTPSFRPTKIQAKTKYEFQELVTP
jgi:large subunit ribosomal protein L3